MINPKRYDPVIYGNEAVVNDGLYVKWEDYEVMRGTLSLAEEGLANATQENASITTQRDHWLQIAREKDAEIERLQAQLRDCEQLLAAHDPKRECGYWLRTQPPTSEPGAIGMMELAKSVGASHVTLFDTSCDARGEVKHTQKTVIVEPTAVPLPPGFILVAQCAGCGVHDEPRATHFSECPAYPGALVRPALESGEHS